MQVTVVIGTESRELDVEQGTSVLSVLQTCGAPVQATCGGAGTCGKCRVLVRTSEELSYRLACQTTVEPGMRVFVDRVDDVLIIAEDGFSATYAPDSGVFGTYGLAFDIGTTTVVCHLHRLFDGARVATASCSNPQVVFGADVLSRINASIGGQLDTMTNAINLAMRDLAVRVCGMAGVELDVIERAVVAGNTVMEHIACGLPPDGIGVSPFTPLSLFGDEHGLAGVTERAFVMPCIAGYVGGDITAGIVATGMQDASTPRLLVDVGTNGEMVIGCGGRMIACATAAGPAFEGANITCGMPAMPGAIVRAEVGDERLDYEVLGALPPVGICGSALIDLLAALLELGVVDETGRILDPDEIDGWAGALVGEVNDAPVVFIAREEGVFLTQRDVRNIQLAKAAICAGALTLLDVFGIGIDDVDELLVAGGFGSSIDVRSAARIGLFPPELADRARAVGNAAGEGASAVLVSQEARTALAHAVEACDYLELSGLPTFNDHYIDCMGFE